MIIHWKGEDGSDRAGPRLAMFSLEKVKYIVVWDPTDEKFRVLNEDEFTVQGIYKIKRQPPNRRSR